jgi:hypothetical protein
LASETYGTQLGGAAASDEHASAKREMHAVDGA